MYFYNRLNLRLKSPISMTKIFLIWLTLGISSCAVYEADYSKSALASRTDMTHEVVYQLFLLGDGGKTTTKTSKRTLKLLKKLVNESGDNTSVLFLGDNVYPDGIPHKKGKKKDEAKDHLKAQLKSVKGIGEKVIFMPGNHDWIRGLDAVKRQETYIEDHLKGKNAFLPNAGCGGPKIVKLGGDVVLMIIDSQWWMTDWQDEPSINSGCDARNRSEFINLVFNYIKKYQEKHLVIASHHTLKSYGPHGGEYSLREHIFPLTSFKNNFWAYLLPLPGIGSLLRRNLGVRQDLYHPQYRDLVDQILNKAKGFENLIFVGGHEHNLQYIYEDNHPFIVSGAASKKAPGRAKGPAQFTYGGGGFVELQFLSDQSVKALFWSSKTNEVLFETLIRQPVKEEKFDFAEYEKRPKTKTLAIYPEKEKSSSVKKLFWGNLHRNKYYQEVEVPVFYLDEKALRPIQKGGGNQTNSIRLQDEEGRQYVLRSMQKDANRIMGGVLKGTFVVDIMKDVFTFSHPYAAFVVPKLADAVGIMHTNPELVYLPKQPGLGHYNESFGNGLYLFEERPAKNRSDVESFGKSTNIISTPDLMELLEDKSRHRVDEDFTLRNRLFDMVIGDWDRHEDQWRWASFENQDGYIYYRPIPRDRDQPFSKFDGLLPQIINKTVPLARQFQSYGPDIKRMKWYNNYARHFDARFLHELEWENWVVQIKHIQKNLTDDDIENAIKSFPNAIYEDGGDELIRNIKSRRDQLLDIGRRYYELLAQIVDVVGTDKDEIFNIEYLEDGKLNLKVLRKKDRDHNVYERTFIGSETKEIHIYGLEGKDKLEVSGSQSRKHPKIRFVGGLGDDKVKISSAEIRKKAAIKVYDSPKGMKIDQKRNVSDKRYKERFFNEHNWKDLNRDYWMIFPALGYNVDDGFSLGANWTYTRFGFKKKPYSQRHAIKALYAFNNEGSTFQYDGIFTRALGKWDLAIQGLFQGPRYAINYFGTGNDSQYDTKTKTLFHQVRQEKYNISLGSRRLLPNGISYQFSLYGDRTTIDKTPDRYISDGLVTSILPEYIFDDHYYVGGKFAFGYDSRNNRVYPSRGILFEAEVEQSHRFENEQDHTILSSSLAIYESLDQAKRFVWATNVGIRHILGDYEFFNASWIGGRNTLRGFRNHRFRGQTAFWNSNDLRYNIGSYQSRFLPFDFGLIASLDHGRVWDVADVSETWHVTYGGGLWVNFLDMLALNATYHRSEEEGQFYLQVQMPF